VGVVCITGGSERQRAALVTALVGELAGRGMSVSVADHRAARLDLDRPGKDSYEHRAAGARAVLIMSSKRWGLVQENPRPRRPTLEEMLARMSPVDIVLAPGFDAASRPRLVLSGKTETVAASSRVDGKILLRLDNPASIADFIERSRHCEPAPS
jgi:molybdopterin-guanine dinucleotide biosynthesis protein B